MGRDWKDSPRGSETSDPDVTANHTPLLRRKVLVTGPLDFFGVTTGITS